MVSVSPLDVQGGSSVLGATEVPAHLSAVTERYDFLEKLGRGTQGQVWLGRRKSDGEKVAIKQLNVHSVTTWKQYELFQREAQMLASLDVAGVVPFVEYIEDLTSNPPCVCIIQKYVEGQSIAAMLKAGHRFEAESIYDIVAQMLKILQALHERVPPVVHRDIKPSNLLLLPTEDGRYRVTLIDFGAVANPQVQTGGSTVAGTFGYMPPEQLMGKSQPASDIYALGALAVELLSGCSPADMAVCDFKLVIEPHLTHLPRAVVQTLSLMLEPAVCNRLCDYNALIAQFSSLANKEKPSFLGFLRRGARPKFEHVESICQAGNYEIWQDFESKQASDLLEDLKHREQYSDDLDLKKSSKPYIIRVLLAFIHIMVGFFKVFAFCIQNSYAREESQEAFALGMAELESEVAEKTGALGIHFGGYGTKKLGDDTETSSKASQKLDCRVIDYRRLGRHMRSKTKCVGKITAIEYVPTSSRESKSMGTDVVRILTDARPRFCVQYTFQVQINNPWASSVGQPEVCDIELCAELVTHVVPEGHYRVGDLLTLVASLTTTDEVDDNKLPIVMLEVMPLPFSLDDVMNDKDMCYAIPLSWDVVRSEGEPDVHGEQLMNLAEMFRERTAYPLAEVVYKQGCAKGCIDALVQLAQMYDVDCNQLGIAIPLYIKAFKSGHALSALRLAQIYKKQRNFREAEIWYYKAYEAGEARAAVYMAKMFETVRAMGYKEQVALWYSKAIEQGDIELLREMGSALLEFGDQEVLSQFYLRYSQMVSEAGYTAEMCEELAEICQGCDEAEGANYWYERAIELYRTGAEQGNVLYCCKLSEFYSQTDDDVSALEWLNTGALALSQKSDPQPEELVVLETLERELKKWLKNIESHLIFQRYSEANNKLNQLKSVLTVNDEFVDYLQARVSASTYLAHGMHAKAIFEYEKAYHATGYAIYAFHLGQLYHLGMREYAEAILWYARCPRDWLSEDFVDVCRECNACLGLRDKGDLHLDLFKKWVRAFGYQYADFNILNEAEAWYNRLNFETRQQCLAWFNKVRDEYVWGFKLSEEQFRENCAVLLWELHEAQK